MLFCWRLPPVASAECQPSVAGLEARGPFLPFGYFVFVFDFRQLSCDESKGQVLCGPGAPNRERGLH